MMYYLCFRNATSCLHANILLPTIKVPHLEAVCIHDHFVQSLMRYAHVWKDKNSHSPNGKNFTHLSAASWSSPSAALRALSAASRFDRSSSTSPAIILARLSEDCGRCKNHVDRVSSTLMQALCTVYVKLRNGFLFIQCLLFKINQIWSS